VEDMIHKSFAFNIPKNVQKLLETYNEVITRESTGFQISLSKVALIPCDNEKIVRLHFHLINPIKFGETSSSIDIQFAKGISNVKNIKIDEVDDDEDEEVKRLYEELEEEVVEEEKQKGLINKWFRDFAKNISIRSGITIDTFRDIKFSRNPFKNQVLLQPTTNCLVHLINLSFLVITMADVEVVNLERIQYGLKNFDMVLIFKDYSHPLVHINTIPMSQLEGVKSWLDSIGIVYYEGTLNLNWTQIVRNINKDPAGFYTNGGLSFLDMDGKDDDDLEVSSDSASEFKLTESEEEDSEAKESVSASELEEESDESVLSQDELKERAPKVDKKIQDIKRKNSNDVHGSSSTNTNKKPSQNRGLSPRGSERDRRDDRHDRDKKGRPHSRPHSPMKGEVSTESSNNPLANINPDEDPEMAMMMLMGITGFTTTKGKKVSGNNDISAVDIKKQRQYRQYMNRRGGFNR
ncbi:6378_t:CDS:10, partial [Entrophospora sp. SA101]